MSSDILNDISLKITRINIIKKSAKMFQVRQSPLYFFIISSLLSLVLESESK